MFECYEYDKNEEWQKIGNEDEEQWRLKRKMRMKMNEKNKKKNNKR